MWLASPKIEVFSRCCMPVCSMAASELGSDAILDPQQICLPLLDALKLTRHIHVQLVGVRDCAPLLNVPVLPPAMQHRAGQHQVSTCKLLGVP